MVKQKYIWQSAIVPGSYPGMWYLLFLLSACLLISCSSHKKISSATRSTSKVSKINRDEFDNLFFEGQKEKLKGDNQKAEEYFHSALKIDNSSADCYYELGVIYFNQSKFKDAESMMQKAVELSPSNKWFLILLGDVYQNQKKWPQSIQVYEKLVNLYPDERDYYLSLASIYFYENKINEAIKIFDRVEKHFGPSDDIVLQKYKIYFTMAKYDKALEEIDKLLKKDQDNGQYLSIKAETLLKAGKEDQAFEIFKKLYSLKPDDPMVQLEMSGYYERKGEKDKSFSLLKQVFANPAMGIDDKVRILAGSYLAKDKLDSTEIQQAEGLCAILVKTHPKEAKAFAIYGDFLYSDKKDSLARDQYMKSIELQNNVYPVWQNVMQIDVELRNNKLLEEDSYKAMELFPNQPLVYFFNGTACTELKKYKKAIEALNSGLALITDEVKMKALVTQMYVTLAEAYYRENQYTKSDKSFESAIGLDANNTLALNNYAYYLSVRNEKLDKAEQMSKKTIDLEPQNASYEDTYGWILYKEHKYTDAETWIAKAIQKDHSGEVSEHYGDVLYMLGKVDEAVKYWEKAKKSGSDNPKLDKKINEKRIVE